ncbi:hypothetical protein WME76_18160 [Sorangium sp. So ce119]|uniref:hypothetical protein n=1 Tax=Sorangium sp. So ce119 TaxID=3133279 RepID=UPI003F626913
MSRRIGTLIFGLVTLSAGSARAGTFIVHYQTANQPSFAGRTQSQTTQDYINAMMASFREVELRSQGAANFQLAGIDEANPPCGGGHIRVRWDAVNAGGNCAFTQPTTGTLCNDISFDATGLVPLNPRWTPDASSRCTSFQAVMTHELGHMMLQNFGLHSANSVVSNPPSPDLLSRHFWNSDMSPSFTFARHWYGFRMERYTPSTGASTLVKDWTSSPTFPGASIAPGDLATQPYSWAWGDNSGLFFRKGDGASTAGAARDFTWNSGVSREFAAYHGVCLASDMNGNYLLAWPSINEVPAFYTDATKTAIDPMSGARAVQFMVSSDRGQSWSSPAAIPFAFTRTSVGCSFDPAAGRFVVAYSGSGEEGLWTTSRPSAGGGGWSFPARLTTPGVVVSTPDPPSVAFDAMGSSGPGWVSWYDNLSGSTMGRIIFDAAGNRYVFNGQPFVSPTLSGDDGMLHSRHAVAVVDGRPHDMYTLNLSPGSTQLHVRARNMDAARVESSSSEVAPPANLARYAGAARRATAGSSEVMLISPFMINPSL